MGRNPTAIVLLGGFVLAAALGIWTSVDQAPRDQPLGDAGRRSAFADASVDDKTATRPWEGETPIVATFSIVACDLEQKEWGVAVQSRVLAVGSIVPFASADVGAIATQSLANTKYGPEGLRMLADGKSAEEVVKALTESDEGRERRQLGVVDREGRAASFTGAKCLEWAGAVSGKNYTCQGNILAGKNVVEDMAKAFEEKEGKLADKMVAALEAGQKAGGDKRGQQSAAILVVRQGAGYAGFDDKLIDLRVDDHATPIDELKRLLDLRLRRTHKPE
ncbi:MAG: DUF1028 domain-containing protein [Planctomycetia bacterium]|nr:DUF1028 domain-containing protein [Planctomycetia bacterium]